MQIPPPKHPFLPTKRQSFWRRVSNYLFKNRWEYFWVDFEDDEAKYSYSMSLNYYGRYGWEAVSYHLSDVENSMIRVLFKRRTRRWNVVMEDDEYPSKSNLDTQNNVTHPYWK